MDGDDPRSREWAQCIREEVARAVELSAEMIALLARCRRTLLEARAVLESVEHRWEHEDVPQGHDWLDADARKTG